MSDRAEPSSKDPSADARFLGWNDSNRRTLFLLLMAAGVYGIVRWWTTPHYVSVPQPSLPRLASSLADKVDPNTADAVTLSALPQVGEKRARDLVAYRDRVMPEQADGIVFHRPLDLLRIPGFGPAMMNQLEPYLLFAPARPSTVPIE